MKSFDPSKYLSPHLKELEAYVPGSQPQTSGWLKLNTNELPYPPSPKVAQAIESEFDRLTLYPDPKSLKLRKAVEEREGLAPGSVIVGNGSDDLLNLLVRLFGGLDQSVGQSFPSYSLYSVLVAISGGQLKSIPFDSSFKLPLDELVESGGGIIFLTSPNAPSGVAFTNAEIENLCNRFDGIIVVDEAYVDFAEESAKSLLQTKDNLVITRTFSKSYGLAGLRVGYAMGNPKIITLLDSVRDSYNVNRLSCSGALAAYEDKEYYASVIARIKSTREIFQQKLKSIGWFYYPSSTNFVFTKPISINGSEGVEVAKSLFNYFFENKVLVRHFANHRLTESFLRISIGTNSQMNQVLDLIEQWQKNVQQQ